MNTLGPMRYHVSAVTGVETPYFPVYHESVYDHQQVADPIALAQEFTTEIFDAGYDGYVDTVTILEGVLTDTMIPSTWIAEVQLSAETARVEPLFVAGSGQTSLLIPIWLIGVITVIVEIIQTAWWAHVAIIAIAFALACYAAPMLRIALFGDPNQYIIPGQGYKSWDQAQSWYAANYWYVCGKNPSISAGLKATADPSLPGPRYTSAASVPQIEVSAWTEACNRAADIKPSGPDWFMTIGIIATLGIGAYILVNVLRFLPRKSQN